MMISPRFTAFAFVAAMSASASAQQVGSDTASIRPMPAAVAQRYGHIAPLLPTPVKQKLDALVPTFLDRVVATPRPASLGTFAASAIRAQFPHASAQEQTVLVFALAKQTADGLAADILNQSHPASSHVAMQRQAVELTANLLQAVTQTADSVVTNMKAD